LIDRPNAYHLIGSSIPQARAPSHALGSFSSSAFRGVVRLTGQATRILAV